MSVPFPPLELPVAQFVAAPQWRCIEFVSDLHLGEHTPATFAAFEHYLHSSDASAIVLLGDVFEAWVGDDAAGSGFEQRCAQLLQAACTRRPCAFMAGNRDFLVGETFLRHCGLVALADPTVLVAFGARTLLTHGDLLCIDDLDYQRFRRMVRGPAWRDAFLAQPLETRRTQVRGMREASEQRKRDVGATGYADLDTAACLQWLTLADAAVMVNGHTHRPGNVALDAGHSRLVLSDWDLEDPRHPRAEILRLSAQGFERRAVASP